MSNFKISKKDNLFQIYL